ncbi:MAG: hypothetical protein V7K47_07085 [Nostoc sp.]
MTQAIFTNAWISQTAKTMFRGAAPPVSNKFYIGLAQTDSLSRNSPLASFISNELSSADYTRLQFNLADDGGYNTNTNRHEFSPVTITFTPSTTTWQFQTAFLLANGHSVASMGFSSSDVNSATNRITISNHPWTSGDRLVFTADDLATLPTGIDAGTIYQVLSPTTNDFALALVNSSVAIDIQNTGSSTFRARSANGIIATFAIEPSLITLLPGQPHSYQIPIALMNTGYVNGS